VMAGGQGLPAAYATQIVHAILMIIGFSVFLGFLNGLPHPHIPDITDDVIARLKNSTAVVNCPDCDFGGLTFLVQPCDVGNDSYSISCVTKAITGINSTIALEALNDEISVLHNVINRALPPTAAGLALALLHVPRHFLHAKFDGYKIEGIAVTGIIHHLIDSAIVSWELSAITSVTSDIIVEECSLMSVMVMGDALDLGDTNLARAIGELRDLVCFGDYHSLGHSRYILATAIIVIVLFVISILALVALEC